jgi:hypothetical protein
LPQDTVFIVDNDDPGILYGWGTAVELSTDERLVIGDDEEANTPPYTSYFNDTVQIRCREVFALPLLLSSYLSPDDFRTYGDGYSDSKYLGGIVHELPPILADKLNQAMGYRRKLGAPIFLSYAKEDFEVATTLYKKLSNRGFDVWIDKISLLPGQDWKHEISRAIQVSRAFIALLSNNSITKRGYVQKELRLGLEVLQQIPPSQIYLIPVRIEPCVPEHPILNDLHWVDLFPDFDVGVQKIVAALRDLE